MQDKAVDVRVASVLDARLDMLATLQQPPAETPPDGGGARSSALPATAQVAAATDDEADLEPADIRDLSDSEDEDHGGWGMVPCKSADV